MAQWTKSRALRWSALALLVVGALLFGGVAFDRTGTATAVETGGCNSCNKTSDCDSFCCANGVRCDAGGCLCLDPE